MKLVKFLSEYRDETGTLKCGEFYAANWDEAEKIARIRGELLIGQWDCDVEE